MLRYQTAELRTEKGLSQMQLGKIIGVSQKAIDYWERNVNEPKASYIIALVKTFDISFDEFQEKLPMYVESVTNLNEDGIKQKHPEIKNFELKEIDDSVEPADVGKEQNTIQISDAYLNYYNGININK